MRAFKILLLLALVCVLSVGVGLAWITSNPEKFKPQLSQLIEERTGLNVHFDGDLHWEIFPNLRLSVSNLKADWSDSKVALVEIASLKLGVALKPLFSTNPKLKVKSINIDGLQITLVETSTGDNWTPPSYTGAPLPPIPVPIAQKPYEKEQNKPSNNWQIDKISITNSGVEYRNTETHAFYSLELESLIASNLAENTSLDFQTRFSFEDTSTRFSAEIEFELVTDTRSQQYHVNELVFQIDDNILTGSAELDLSAVPFLSFALNADELTLTEIETVSVTQQSVLSFAADYKPVASQQNNWESKILPDNFTSLLNWNGSLDVNSLWLAGEQFNKVTVNTQKQNAITDLKLYLPDFFRGQAQIHFQLDTETQPYRWEIVPDIKNADTQQLSYWLNQKLEWVAPLVLGGTIKTEGNTRRTLANNIKASTSFDGQKGQLNIAEIRRQALAVTRYTGGAERVANWPQVLEYEKFIGFWNIDGQVHNLDLTLDNLSLDANGLYDPVEDYMDMHVTLTIHENEQLNSFDVNGTLRELPIPVRCKGSAQAPRCKLDKKGARRLLADALSGNSNDAINEKLSRKIDEQVPEEYRDTARALLKGLGDLLGNSSSKDGRN